MKHLTAIILAGGKSKRFGGKVNKNLFKVDGAPLISRTIAQLKKRGVPTWVLVRDKAPYVAAGVKANFFEPVRSRWQTEGLLVSRKYWGRDQVLILFGDAYYSEACMDLLVAGKTIFYCSTAEIWGVSIDSRWYTRAEQIARKVIKYLEKHRHLNENLWRFYYFWYGQPFCGVPKHKWTPGLAFRKAGRTIMVFDETVDFDRPGEYERWQRGVRGRQVKAPHRAPLCVGRKIVQFIGETENWRCPITKKVYRGFLHCEPKGCPHHVPQS